MTTDQTQKNSRIENLLLDLSPFVWHSLRSCFFEYGKDLSENESEKKKDLETKGKNFSINQQRESWVSKNGQEKFESQKDFFNKHVDELSDRFQKSVLSPIGLETLLPDQSITVVMPVYNEQETLRDVVKRVAMVPSVDQIVLVNDGSGDGTHQVCEEIVNRFREFKSNDLAPEEGDSSEVFSPYFLPKGIDYIPLEENRGKGFAIRKGFEQAVCPWVAIQDADTEYNPSDLHRLLMVASDSGATIVYGNRFDLGVDVRFSEFATEFLSAAEECGFSLKELSSRGPERKDVSPKWHQSANWALSRIASFRCGISIHDIETCQKLISTDLLRQVLPKLTEDRFGIEVEMTIKLAKLANAQFAEAPISYDRRGYEEGKKIGWKDGVRAVYCLFAY